MKNYLHAFLNNNRLHLFWLPAMLVAWSVYALVPLHLGSILLGLVWVSALAFGFLTLLALIGARTSLLEKASDIADLNNKLRWLHPLIALLAVLVLALAADMLINWLRGPSDEQEVILRRVYCTSDSNRIPRVRLPQKDGKWCFETQGRDTVINLPFLGRHAGYDILHTEIPITQSPHPVSLGETLPARRRSYHSIFGVADAYYQITDIH